MEIGEVRRSPLRIDGSPASSLRRSASVRGEWQLWISCCRWTLSLDADRLAGSESDSTTIARALGALNGQALTSVEVLSGDGRSEFAFDLGCRLETEPFVDGTFGDDPIEQWHLYQPSGLVLSVRSDGTWHQGPANEPSDEVWTPIPPSW